MGDVVSTDSESYASQSSTGLSKWEKFKRFLKHQKAETQSVPQKEPYRLLSISELKEQSKVPSQSGYEKLIDDNQAGRPDDIHNPTANELARLYPDFISYINDPTSDIPDNERGNFLQRLDSGDKTVIKQLAEMVKRKYLGNESYQVVEERSRKGRAKGPEDLKIVLADQLAKHLEISERNNQQRVAQEKIIEADYGANPTSPQPVSATVIRQINNPGPK